MCWHLPYIMLSNYNKIEMREWKAKRIVKWHNQTETKCGNMQRQTQTNWKKKKKEQMWKKRLNVNKIRISVVCIDKNKKQKGSQWKWTSSFVSVRSTPPACKWIAGKRAIKWQQKMAYKRQIQCKWMGFLVGWWKSIFNQVKGNKALKCFCMTAIQNAMVKIFVLFDLRPQKYI